MMTDEVQPPSPGSSPDVLPAAPASVPPQSKKPNRVIWLILALSAAAVCLCTIVCVALVVFGVTGVMKEKPPVESVLDSYMKLMAAKKVENAYALFSPRAQRQIPLAKLQGAIKGNNYVLFEGYRSLSVNNLNISAAVNTDPNLPQGTVAQVTGTIVYEGNFQGQFNAVLEKVNGTWKLDGINIMVPPDKFPQ